MQFLSCLLTFALLKNMDFFGKLLLGLVYLHFHVIRIRSWVQLHRLRGILVLQASAEIQTTQWGQEGMGCGAGARTSYQTRLSTQLRVALHSLAHAGLTLVSLSLQSSWDFSMSAKLCPARAFKRKLLQIWKNAHDASCPCHNRMGDENQPSLKRWHVLCHDWHVTCVTGGRTVVCATIHTLFLIN